MAINNGKPFLIKPDTTVVFQSFKETKGWHQLDAGSEFSCLDLRYSSELLKEYGVDALNQNWVDSEHIAKRACQTQGE